MWQVCSQKIRVVCALNIQQLHNMSRMVLLFFNIISLFHAFLFLPNLWPVVLLSSKLLSSYRKVNLKFKRCAKEMKQNMKHKTTIYSDMFLFSLFLLLSKVFCSKYFHSVMSRGTKMIKLYRYDTVFFERC